ncbi:methyltransferase domain-containing protein [Frigidibacter sp. MR17.24]|uniref:methyltransferase domain-containing protein n=1 Tax=Frigidibacter sp. MR17.24 TaxID=3127345 RepID=UPI00301301CF
MSTPPSLTDRAALEAHRARARARGPELFLHDEAAAEIEERLAEVNRTFTSPVVIAPFAAPWQAILPGVRVIADDEVLDLTEGAQDLVIHAMALHWAEDPVGQLIQCRRALKPDGLFLGVLFGGRTLNEARSALAEAEIATAGGLSPRVLPMGEIRDLGALLQRAGFALPVADSAVKTVEYGSLTGLLRDLRGMGETNALAARLRRPMSRAMLAAFAAAYGAAFATPGGRLRASFELIFLTGWAPHDSQQQPLRPGSAKQRLADALKVPETRLPGDG